MTEHEIRSDNSNSSLLQTEFLQHGFLALFLKHNETACMVSNDTLIQHTAVNQTVSGAKRTQLLDSIKKQLNKTTVISFSNCSCC